LSSEIRHLGEPAVLDHPEGKNARCDHASAARTRGVEDPRHAEKLPAREPGDSAGARNRKAAGRRENARSGKSLLHDSGEWYCGVVLAKQPNNGGIPPAEVVEGRPQAKENTLTVSPVPGHRGGLECVRETAKKDGKRKSTALLHQVRTEGLRDSYYRLKKQAAPGVDGVTWAEALVVVAIGRSAAQFGETFRGGFAPLRASEVVPGVQVRLAAVRAAPLQIVLEEFY
jgi:hypothetical protein